MNLLKSPVRRATAVLAGAVLGMAGAVAFAAPAMATHPTVTGTADCVAKDGWKVTWTVTNDWEVEGEVRDVILSKPEGAKLIEGGQIVIGATLKRKSENPKLVSEQLVPANELKAKLRVSVKFPNHTGGGEQVIPRPEKVCDEPEDNPTPGPSGSTGPSQPPVVGDAEPIIKMDCDTLTFGLDNPADGDEIKLTLTTSKGETRKLTVKPGEQKVEKFSATPGFVLTVKDEASGESFELPYTQPADCSGSGSGGGGEEPELPLTGAAAGGIAGGAALLLAAGAFLFVMARRRKVKFTA